MFMQTHAAICHAAVMMKVDLDGRDLLTINECKASSLTLEAAVALEGELKEVRGDIKALKSKSKADEAELKSAQKEVERHVKLLQYVHAVLKGLEIEKLDLLRHNDKQVQDTEEQETELERLKTDIEQGRLG